MAAKSKKLEPPSCIFEDKMYLGLFLVLFFHKTQNQVQKID
jgi:hypothetical protein